MKKTSKLVLSLALAFGLVACGTKEEPTPAPEPEVQELAKVNILCPTGAPGIAFVGAYDEITKEGKIDFCSGTDELIANLSKEDSEYDVIVAPINLGCKLMMGGQTNYKLKAVLTWGNLFLVGTDEEALNGEGQIALFGQGAVPEKIYTACNIETSLEPTYYAEAPLVQQELLAGNVSVGMLAEPLATATIAKAKENNIELKIIKDLQAVYGEGGYPQAAVFVKENNQDVLMSKVDDFTNNGYENLETLLDTIGVEMFKLPSTAIVVKTMERQNVHYKDAAQCTQEITDFLKLFNIEFSEDMLAK